MSNLNLIQSRITQLEGGAFQKLFDEYLYKKYSFKNIQTLGVQTGTNKPTKGIPDAYVHSDDGKYILINYGTVKSQPANKIKEDILSSFNVAKLSLGTNKISRIICGHCSTNISLEQFDDIINAIQNVQIELIGIDTLSHDLSLKYPHIAKDHLGINIDTDQFYDIRDFISVHDANGINAPINYELLHREDYYNKIYSSIQEKQITVLTGAPGIGKTRLALEVCRQFEEEQFKVFCIRSNGQLLYDDIKYYIDKPGSYLLFFDDANMVASLKSVIDSLLRLSNGYTIKILVTVRDYAKDRVIEALVTHDKPTIIEIKRFKDEELKNILKSNLGIVNVDSLNRIAQIADGNIRLAVLAGLRLKENGLLSIRNAEDIFKNYYGRIIDETKIAKNDILLLSFLAMSGPVKRGEQSLYSLLMKEYGDDICEEKAIERLYSLELIDWFYKEIINISDQSFGNYILYYVLYEKKWITIKDLLKISFPIYKNKIVYSMNTLVALFQSDDIKHYLETEIISAWECAPSEYEMAYLDSFYCVAPIKALSIIKRHIDREEEIDFDLLTFDFKKKANNHHIKTREIEILGDFKYTNYYKEAVNLMSLFFQKRPDLIMDFYFSITDRLFDRYAYKTNYSQESIVINELWDATKEGEEYNETILFLHVAKYALQTEFTHLETMKNGRTINIIRVALAFSEQVVNLRDKIWEDVGMLRNKEQYYDMVNDILLDDYINGLDDQITKLFLQSDFNSIYRIIGNDQIGFVEARIIDKYRDDAEQLALKYDDRYERVNENPEYRMYKLLKNEYLAGESFEDSELKRRDAIKSEIDTYQLTDYEELFNACEFIEKRTDIGEWYQLGNGLEIVFELLESDEIMYIKILSAYFAHNTPFNLRGYKQVDYLLNHLGYSRTLKIITEERYDSRLKWETIFWECLDSNQVTKEIAEDYKHFLFNNIDNLITIIPSVEMLNIYGSKDDEIRKIVINKLTEEPSLAYAFLSRIHQETDIDLLMEVFSDSLQELSFIYICSLGQDDQMDYGGRIFKRVFEIQPQIWFEYINWINEKCNTRWSESNREIIETIWACDNWRNAITYAFNTLISKNGFQFAKKERLLFQKINNPNIIERMKDWLKKELEESIHDIQR